MSPKVRAFFHSFRGASSLALVVVWSAGLVWLIQALWFTIFA
jgi:hypothetical protein